MTSSNASVHSPYTRSSDSNERRTSRRGFSAILRMSNSPTDVDPVSILMGKTSAFFGHINEAKFKAMCAEHGWDAQKGRAYIESVTSAPFDTYQNPVVYSETRLGLPHPMADKERIVWIQGTIYDESGRAYNPGETINALQIALRNDPSMASHIDNIVWKENALGTSAIKMRDKMRRGEHVPLVFWTKNVENELTLQDQQWAELDKEPAENPMVRYAYITPAGRMRKLSDLIRDLANWLVNTNTNSNIKNDTMQLVRGTDVAFTVRAKAPSALPVQTAYQSSHGLLYVLERPSVFPASQIGRLTDGRFSVELTSSMTAVAYVVHDPFQSMRPITNFTADFCWEYREGSWHMHAMPTALELSGHSPILNMRNLYEVADPSFCMGWGSVAIAWHTNLGIGASLHDKRIREEVRVQRGLREISGHAISSLMMHPAHFLWYLHELATNYITRTSIYTFLFDEHRTGRYHDLEEYRAGLDVADRLKLPQYARSNTRVFRRVLDALQDVVANDEKSF